MSKVICIDDTNRPSDFPLSIWIKKGDRYTITSIKVLPQQGGIKGCQLAERPDMPFPHKYFRLSRFREIEDDFDEDLQNALDEVYSEILVH